MESSSSSSTVAVLGLCVCLVLISPAVSLTCSTSQISKSKHKFDQCVDLPTLDSYLHYSYNATNSSLSIAFVASPAKPEGWIAWAINPTGTGMSGSQALIAYKSNHTAVVKTYDITSYSSVNESKLSFETWDLKAEATSNGSLIIYGSMKVAEKAEKLNQVWQVGSEVQDGKPRKHAFLPQNINAKGTLVLEKATAPSPSPSTSTPEKGGQSSIKSNNLSFFFAFILFISAVFFS
ncbi:hypothetical protein LWI29_009174 [Acer saccharum]|uniref:DOMON domain-containing protein n=1 Tax=Acer saccharum TaxID=4024 RepID=A0AA39SDL8_ACESA|nr:hypothetical protein LWI29_009174 [Acer saccharum]KAK1579089.1 hypothetical protein Q3G72_035470 [Acer saccharum]